MREILVPIALILSVIYSYNYNANMKERKELAVVFFEESDISKKMQIKYIEGMILHKTVSIDIVKKGKILAQYQKPEAPQGFFYTCVECCFKGLGIPMEGRERRLYQALKDTQVLKSTAGSKVWEIEGKRTYTIGGETQMFTSCLDCFELVP